MVISAVETKPDLEKYELGEQIGLGGMATVYRARDRRLGRDVAIKLIHPHLRGSVEVATRFASEGRTVAKLKHPNIVEVYDISDEDELERYLVVELIKGPTLREVLKNHGPMPPEVAAALGLQLAAALSHAHDEGIVHRDVKPENVLIQLSSPTTGDRAQGTRASVKLTDFGIAKLLDAHGVTSTGQVLGSPAHMAPEQIEGGDVGPRADVFGLGVLLYESMVGQLPFDGKNPAQVLRRVLEGAHPSAVRVRPVVGAIWSALLDRALARDAADRPESTESFASAMRDELAAVGFEPQAELDAYFQDPVAYSDRVSERLVPPLAANGQAARAQGDIGRARDQFNRALAYKPGDADLVQRVSSIARRNRMVRVGRRVGLGAAVLAAGVTAAYALRNDVPASRAGAEQLLPESDEPRLEPALPMSPVLEPAASATATASVTVPAEPAARRKSTPPVLQPVRPREPDPPETRRVEVTLEGGARGGTLHIDGEPQHDWLSRRYYDLKPGMHTFSFRLNEPDCCDAQPVQKLIEPGEDSVSVALHVSYRDAELIVRGRPGSMSCPSLFAGILQVPSSKQVPMRDPDVTESCTYTPDSPSSSPPWSGRVNLRAGNTTEVTMP